MQSTIIPLLPPEILGTIMTDYNLFKKDQCDMLMLFSIDPESIIEDTYNPCMENSKTYIYNLISTTAINESQLLSQENADYIIRELKQKQNIYTIIHYLELYNVLDKDIKIETFINSIRIYVNNMNVVILRVSNPDVVYIRYYINDRLIRDDNLGSNYSRYYN